MIETQEKEESKMNDKDQCNEIRALLSFYVDNELSEEEFKQVESHLENCPACKEEYLEMLEIIELLQEVPEEKIPDQFEFRLKQALAEEGKQIREKIQVTEQMKKKKYSWRMISSIAAIFIVGIISYISFEEIPMLQYSSMGKNVNESSSIENATKDAKYGDLKYGGVKKKAAVDKQKQVSDKKDTEESKATVASQDEKDNSILQAKVNTDTNQNEKSMNENLYRSPVPAGGGGGGSNENLQSDAASQNEEVKSLCAPNQADIQRKESYSNQFDEMQTSSSKELQTSSAEESKEFYEQLIANKLDGFQYKIKSCTNVDGQWNFAVFIFTGKDGMIINKEIEVVGKGRQIEVLYADEFMGL